MSQGDPALLDRRLASGWQVVSNGEHSTLRRPDGLSCEAGYIPADSGDLFAVFHDPAEAAVLGVVVCPPLLAEAVRNQRRELILAWELSAAGIAAVRFHYAGSGHSQGDPTTLSFAGLVDDAVAAAETLRTRTGVSQVAFVGTRLGALVAAGAAARFEGAPMVLWEPPLNLQRYFTEVFRARVIGMFKRGEAAPQSQKSLLEEMERNGSVDIAGNPLGQALYRSTIDLNLDQLLTAAGPRRVLIVQMSVKPELRAPLAALVAARTGDGQTVEAVVVPHDEAWWFGATGRTIVETSSDSLEAIPLTVEFIGAGRGAAAGTGST